MARPPSPWGWRMQHDRNLQVVIEQHMTEWMEAVDPESDLVCLECFGLGPWEFCYAPMTVTTGHSLNPVVVLCRCGAGLTFEQGLTLKDIHCHLQESFDGL